MRLLFSLYILLRVFLLLAFGGEKAGVGGEVRMGCTRISVQSTLSLPPRPPTYCLLVPGVGERLIPTPMCRRAVRSYLHSFVGETQSIGAGFTVHYMVHEEDLRGMGAYRNPTFSYTDRPSFPCSRKTWSVSMACRKKHLSD